MSCIILHGTVPYACATAWCEQYPPGLLVSPARDSTLQTPHRHCTRDRQSISWAYNVIYVTRTDKDIFRISDIRFRCVPYSPTHRPRSAKEQIHALQELLNPLYLSRIFMLQMSPNYILILPNCSTPDRHLSIYHQSPSPSSSLTPAFTHATPNLSYASPPSHSCDQFLNETISNAGSTSSLRRTSWSTSVSTTQ